jgi:lactoylglutathione lyase
MDIFLPPAVRSADAPTAMPLLTISGIDHINMCVTDLARSIAFYQQVFGFEIKEDHRELDEYPWVTVGIANVAYLVLYETEKARQARDMRIVHFGFALAQPEQMDDLLRRIQHAGIATKKDAQGAPLVAHYERSSSIYLSDPDGYALDISIRFGGALDQPELR